MFGTFSRLGEISVRIFDPRVLVAVAKLSREAGVGVAIALFAFSGTLGAVGIVIRDLIHG